ncbi:MAG: hypothetical protein PHS23_06820 [Candidatus Cloacimonetes bacterium]|nr:hypothetical protein [Candidatus Cloacimonadota bacterium]
MQYSYYNSGITINSAGGPVNYTGATSSEAMTTNQNTYVNWDFTSVWSFTTNSYPYSAGSAPTLYYYKSTSSGNWSTPGTWKTSPTDGGSYETLTSIYPDFTNSAGIIIGVATSVDVDVFVDNMKVDSGQSLTISSGKKLYVQNGEIETELTNNGTITVTDTLEVGQSAGFQNNGILNINGTFINSGTTDWASGTTNIGVDSTIKYNGALAQSTGNGFPSSIQNMEIDNAAGVTFTNPFTINGTLTVTDGLVGGTTNTDGFHSMNFQRLEIAESGNLISGFSAATDLGGNYPEHIKRQWTINGYINNDTEANRVKTMSFIGLLMMITALIGPGSLLLCMLVVLPRESPGLSPIPMASVNWW